MYRNGDNCEGIDTKIISVFNLEKMKHLLQKKFSRFFNSHYKVN